MSAPPDATSAKSAMPFDDLEPRDRAVLYWRTLDAPVHRIARALHCSTNEVEERLAGLAEHDGAFPSAPRSHVPWPQRTLNHLIRLGLDRAPSQQFGFIEGEGAVTVGEVRSLVERLGTGLIAQGMGQGDYIAVDSAPRFENFLVALAAVLIGAIVVRLGETVGPQSLRGMIRTAPSRLTFSARHEIIGALAEAGERITLDPDPTLRTFDAFLDDAPDPSTDFWTRLPEVSPTDPAFVGFTSGSTGEPKLVLMSQEAVYRVAETTRNRFGFDATDTFCSPMDFTSNGGLRSLITLPLASGARIVFLGLQSRTNPLALALACRQFGVTRLTIPPSVLRSLVKATGQVRREDLSSVRTVHAGTSNLDQHTTAAFRERFGCPVIDHYGSREYANFVVTDIGDPETITAGGGWVRECLIALVDEGGNEVAHGQPGEIVVHGDAMTPSVLPSIETDGHWAGWYFTGDFGRVLPNGRLELVGRKRDVIKSQEGTLVSPAEVEGVLNALDWVSEAAVFSWIDAGGIERVAAAVALLPHAPRQPPSARETEAKGVALEALGPFKTPVHVLILDELPRVARNKPDKPRLRAMLTETVDARRLPG